MKLRPRSPERRRKMVDGLTDEQEVIKHRITRRRLVRRRYHITVHETDIETIETETSLPTGATESSQSSTVLDRSATQSFEEVVSDSESATMEYRHDDDSAPPTKYQFVSPKQIFPDPDLTQHSYTPQLSHGGNLASAHLKPGTIEDQMSSSFSGSHMQSMKHYMHTQHQANPVSGNSLSPSVSSLHSSISQQSPGSFTYSTPPSTTYSPALPPSNIPPARAPPTAPQQPPTIRFLKMGSQPLPHGSFINYRGTKLTADEASLILVLMRILGVDPNTCAEILHFNRHAYYPLCTSTLPDLHTHIFYSLPLAGHPQLANALTPILTPSHPASQKWQALAARLHREWMGGMRLICNRMRDHGLMDDDGWVSGVGRGEDDGFKVVDEVGRGSVWRAEGCRQGLWEGEVRGGEAGEMGGGGGGVFDPFVTQGWVPL